MERNIFYLGILSIASLIACSGSSFDTATEIATIEQEMKNSETAWNNGNLEAFMDGYIRRDELRFVGNRITHGWQQTLDSYKKGYPDKAAMGHLSFSDLDIRILSPESAFVFGRYTLHRESDMPTGYFTLLMEKHGDRWLIAHDHSSPAGKPVETE